MPKGTEKDDEECITQATSHGGWILSSDNFNNFSKKYELKNIVTEKPKSTNLDICINGIEIHEE